MRRIKANHRLMTSSRLIATIVGIVVAAPSQGRADWVSDIASIGLPATIDAGKTAGMLDARVKAIDNLLTATKAIPEFFKHQQDYNLGLGTTLKDQALVSGAGWAAGKALSTTLIAPCFASGTCAIIGAGSAGVATFSAAALVGAGIDAALAGKIVEGLVDYGHEEEQRIASQQYAKVLQQRVDEQRAIKKQLQTQQGTPQWREQRSRQLALQTVVRQTASPPNVLSAPPNSTSPKSRVSPLNSPSISARGSSSEDGFGSNFLRTVTTDPNRPLNERQKAAQALSASPSDRQLVAMDLGWDPTGLVRGSVQAPQPNAKIAARAPALNSGLSSPSISSASAPKTQGVAAAGGVSLSRAAADRMPLEFALDASALSDGKIVLSGRASKTRMDAALFLTALRAACGDRDPYFSLDPDNGALWSQQGDQASDEFWEKIKRDFPSDAPAQAKNAQPGVNIRTVSATQDYPGIWHDISPHYPNFHAKLVFYPEWLRQTRLGEVLYKADVLLKELSSGVSILVPGKLRAAAIQGYLSADVEYAAKALLTGTRDQLAGHPQWHGSRLWFEITPSELPTTIMNEVAARSSFDDPALRSLLQSKGLIRTANQSVHNASFFLRHGSVFDLSQVNPIMFVRVHDPATNEDLSDHDPRLDGLATDVSARFDQYAKFYEELGLLREVFRAYIAARKITEANDRLCGALDAMPLLDSEKLAGRLPEYHPSELFVTIASYSTASRKGGQTLFVKASSMSGGVSIAGQKFVETAMRDGETTVTRSVEAALAGVNLGQPDAIDSDRKFISFIVDDGSGAPMRLASNANDPSSPRSLSDYPIENEPRSAATPFASQNGHGGSGSEGHSLIGALLTLIALGLLVNYVARKRRIAGG
ncbi:hypothetical protein ACVW1C_003323 [Bradyrhizobium sp. USDA 4011]